jgi:hypothetical protein
MSSEIALSKLGNSISQKQPRNVSAKRITTADTTKQDLPPEET